jgi:hypothetical protein
VRQVGVQIQVLGECRVNGNGRRHRIGLNHHFQPLVAGSHDDIDLQRSPAVLGMVWQDGVFHGFIKRTRIAPQGMINVAGVLRVQDKINRAVVVQLVKVDLLGIRDHLTLVHIGLRQKAVFSKLQGNPTQQQQQHALSMGSPHSSQSRTITDIYLFLRRGFVYLHYCLLRVLAIS